MSQKHLKHTLFTTTAISAAVASLLAPLSAAAADPAPQSRQAQPNRGARIQQFGLVNVAAGQGLRVNIASADPPDGTPSDCNVTATLFAADGSVLVQEQARLAPGQSHVLDFSPRSALALRASVAAANNPPDTRPERMMPCAVLSTLEVYDSASGETRVLSLPARLLADIPDGSPR